MKLTLIKKQKEAKDTMSFWFKPEKPFKYYPGQYFFLTLPKIDYPDPKGKTRHFSIITSPTEGEKIAFCTRLRKTSGFKRTLSELPPGSVIEGEGPSGTFILDEAEKGHHLLIVGGIGITPFRSIIKYHTDKKLSSSLHLLYSNSTPKDIVFEKGLKEMAENNPNLTFSFTITQKPYPSNWPDLKGRVDEEMIRSLVKDIPSTTFWVCGPPVMVEAMVSLLKKMGISSRNLRSEEFSGY